MNPFLVTSALSLAGRVVEALATPAGGAKTMPSTAGAGAPTSFSAELLATERLRLKALGSVLAQSPAVQTARELNAGAPAEIVLGTGGEVALQLADGRRQPLQLDSASAGLIQEARQIMAQHPQLLPVIPLP